MNNASLQREILKGRYEFNFPFSSGNQTMKFLQATQEPMCFFMYKRGDLKNKIDAVDISKLKTAERFHALLMQVKQDILVQRELLGYLKRKKQARDLQ